MNQSAHTAELEMQLDNLAVTAAVSRQSSVPVSHTSSMILSASTHPTVHQDPVCKNYTGKNTLTDSPVVRKHLGSRCSVK